MSPKAKKAFKVGVSGVVATAIDVGALVVLVEMMGVFVTLAAFLAAAAGGVSNYLLNKYWAFEDKSPIRLKQVSAYAFVSLTTALFVAGSVHVFAVILGMPYLGAKALAAILVFICWSYPAQARFVFPQTGQAAS